MIDPTEAPDDKVTHTDWVLARAFFPLLVDLAQKGPDIEPFTYGELIEKARTSNPDVPEVQRTIPLSAGRGLGTMRKFTRKLGYPDVSCLAVSASKKECGTGYTDFHEAVAARANAYGFQDWATVLAAYDGFAEEEPKKRPAKVKKTTTSDKTTRAPTEAMRKAATIAMSEYFYQNKASLPPTITTKRNQIVEWIADGETAANAFARAIKSL